MLSLISDSLQFFLDYIPRSYRIDSTYVGVSTWFGRHSKVLKPGTHFHWPAFQEIQVESAMERNDETSIFSAVTADGRTFQCRMHIRWQVINVMSFQFSVNCGHSYMELSAQSAAVEHIGALTREEVLEQGAHDLSEEVLRAISEGCDERGIVVHGVKMNLFSPATPLFHSRASETEAGYQE